MTTDPRQLAEAELDARQSGCHTWAWDNATAPDCILALLDVVDKAREVLECFDSYSCLNEMGQARMEDEAGELRDALRTALAALGSHQGKQ